MTLESPICWESTAAELIDCSCVSALEFMFAYSFFYSGCSAGMSLSPHISTLNALAGLYVNQFTTIAPYPSLYFVSCSQILSLIPLSYPVHCLMLL